MPGLRDYQIQHMKLQPFSYMTMLKLQHILWMSRGAFHRIGIPFGPKNYERMIFKIIIQKSKPGLEKGLKPF